jgi:outer membrane protein assembly factor BamE
MQPKNLGYYRTRDRGSNFMKSFIAICGVAVLASGCAAVHDQVANTITTITEPIAYRPPTRQGNVLDQNDLNKLQLGMTKDQVRFVLGTPIGTSPFTPDRWDYVGYYKSPRGQTTSRTVSLNFNKDGQLASMQGVSAEMDKSVLSTPDAKALAQEERMYKSEDARAGDGQEKKMVINQPTSSP